LFFKLYLYRVISITQEKIVEIENVSTCWTSWCYSKFFLSYPM